MKGKIYAICLLTLFFAGAVGVFFAASYSLNDTVAAIAGFATSIVVAPVFHELGHILFAAANGMHIRYTKFFCFRIYERDGKALFSFANPFTADETQVVAKTGDDMQRRTLRYVSGGLIFGGWLLLLLLVPAVVLSCFGIHSFALWGMVPYCAYLFFLNVVPAEYAMGKTDALVYGEIRKGLPQGEAMVRAMQIQGRLFAGESFAEIEEECYCVYGLREDEPLYALLWDLKYRYHLEKGELPNAADCLNRLIGAVQYLSLGAYESLRVETAYMRLLQMDASALKELMEKDEAFLRSDDYRAKRLLATYAAACGETEKAERLVAQAKAALGKERITGLKKHEYILLERLTTHKQAEEKTN